MPPIRHCRLMVPCGFQSGRGQTDMRVSVEELWCWCKSRVGPFNPQGEASRAVASGGGAMHGLHACLHGPTLLYELIQAGGVPRGGPDSPPCLPTHDTNAFLYLRALGGLVLHGVLYPGPRGPSAGLGGTC